jgi:hypothetical protein
MITFLPYLAFFRSSENIHTCPGAWDDNLPAPTLPSSDLVKTFTPALGPGMITFLPYLAFFRSSENIHTCPGAWDDNPAPTLPSSDLITSTPAFPSDNPHCPQIYISSMIFRYLLIDYYQNRYNIQNTC